MEARDGHRESVGPTQLEEIYAALARIEQRQEEQQQLFDRVLSIPFVNKIVGGRNA